MIQKAYIAVYNFIFDRTSGISERTRNNVLMSICAAVAFCMVFINHRVLDHNTGTTVIIGSVVVVAMSILSVNKEMDRIEWNRSVIWPFALFGAGIILIAFIHPIGDGYLALAMDHLVVFPAFYFVWINRGDHESLYRMIAYPSLITGCFSFICCLVLALRGALKIYWNGDISGHATNPNVLGMTGVMFFIAAVYMLLEDPDRYPVLLLSSFCIGTGMGYAKISVSRSAMLVEALSAAAIVIFALKNRGGGERDHAGSGTDAIPLTRKILIMTLTIIASLAIVLNLAAINNRVLAAKAESPAASVNAASLAEAIVPAVYAEDAAQPADLTSTYEFLEEKSSGRFPIWHVYIQNFSWFGKSLNEIRDQFPPGTEYRAHNNMIDYIYRCGYIVGGFYVIYYVAVAVACLRLLFGRRYNKPKHLFAVMVTILYLVYAMLEISTMPFCRCVICMYFLCAAPLFGRLEDF